MAWKTSAYLKTDYRPMSYKLMWQYVNILSSDAQCEFCMAFLSTFHKWRKGLIRSQVKCRVKESPPAPGLERESGIKLRISLEGTTCTSNQSSIFRCTHARRKGEGRNVQSWYNRKYCQAMIVYRVQSAR